MACEFNFYLSNEDTDRIFALKAEEGKDSLTANQYAKEVLEAALYRLHPQKVQIDENTGAIIPRKKRS